MMHGAVVIIDGEKKNLFFFKPPLFLSVVWLFKSKQLSYLRMLWDEKRKTSFF